MLFFVLLQILPTDLVHYISQIIIRDEAVNIIRKKFLFNRSISDTITGIIYFSLCNNNNALITKDIVSSFKTVIDNNIPQKYNKQFWQHVLNITSRKLHQYYTLYCLHSNNNNNNDNYKNLKIIIKMWLNLCKKFNITINCCEYLKTRSVYLKSSFTYVKSSRHILKLSNYIKHLYPPTVVNQQGDMLEYSDNMVYISQFSSQFTNI
jgi:hypothetical protein